MNTIHFWALAGAVLLAPLAPASAHTPYLLPNAFDAERPRVTLQGALTEDDYFNPDIALPAPSYVETLPSGEQTLIKPNIVLQDLAVTEAPLADPGTYRFSTGAFVARTGELAYVGGKWMVIRQPRPGRAGSEGGQQGGAKPSGQTAAKSAGDGDGPPNVINAADVPPDAKRMQTQSIMTVETYVSKGAPTDTALKTAGQGFELKPTTHPNAIYVDQGFAFQFLLDGKPVSGAAISVYRGGNGYDDQRIASQLKTDAQGNALAKFTQPGVYLLTTSYPAADATPPGDAPPTKSYTYSLTFEVTR